MISAEKIARILKTDENIIEAAVSADVLGKIVEENEKKIKEKTVILGGANIYDALLGKAEEDDKKLPRDFPGLLNEAKKLARVGNGLFLKKEKAKEFLLNTPPRNVKLTRDEDLFEVFASLRFVEDDEWMNKVFFKQYENLTPDDFEERSIKTIVLSDKWENVAEEFLKKKYHNVSHLKELGVIFILPATTGIAGESLRTLSLVLHYYHEIDFYSKLFRKYSKSDNFADDLISSLRGDVLGKKLELGQWMIIQQYLAKYDKNDWRLSQPHVNPEAIHYKKSEDEISVIFDFWKDLDWVGDEFASFNLTDTVFSLVRRKEGIKYIYHHQEALWNKIFYEFVGLPATPEACDGGRGEDKMEEMIIDNFEKGYIEL